MEESKTLKTLGNVVCLSVIAVIIGFWVLISALGKASEDAQRLKDENEKLRADNKQLALRILEWEDAAKHVLKKAQAESEWNERQRQEQGK